MKTVRLDRPSLAALPGVVSSVFPTVVCPACWPAYTGFLSALGLPFIPTGSYLFPATVGFLAIAVIALALGVRRTQRSAPLLLGVAGSAAVLAGRFVLAASAMTYLGAGVLLVASVWNSIPRRAPASAQCGGCSSNESLH